MISYDNFWKTLKNKNISQYKLTVHFGISNSQINRMKKGEHITTATLENLCRLLDCNIEDIVTYIPDQSLSGSEAVAEQSESAYRSSTPSDTK